MCGIVLVRFWCVSWWFRFAVFLDLVWVGTGVGFWLVGVVWWLCLLVVVSCTYGLNFG